MIFSNNDIEQIKSHGLSVEDVTKQLEQFSAGFPFVDIVKPALHTDGVVEYNDSQCQKYIDAYNEYAMSHKIVKFVPASGAATRMFKDLFEFLAPNDINQTTKTVIENVDKFAFWDELQKYLSQKPSESDVINAIINEPGLNYGKQPKALIAFHKYDDGANTPLAEHLDEGGEYAKSSNGVNIHFTISPEHRHGFENLLNRIVPQYESKYGVQYNISLSEQKLSTDTIAVNPDNTPFRNDDETLLFRPAGHGALIENLNDIDADIIFIKNIDNVTTRSLRQDTIKYKKVLAGVLIETQKRIFNLIDKIDNGTPDITEIHEFIVSNLGIKLEKQLDLPGYRNILNRPLRVCGVVKNTGAPGGGPFWVRDQNNNVTLQIVESSQIAPESKDIMQTAEYFNPVDLVCGVKDFQNNKFDLRQYIDENTGFISEKSKNGRALRAMERPGLWNGAMAKWNTVFVVVPASTFTPVKVVTDLLGDVHQTK